MRRAFWIGLGGGEYGVGELGDVVALVAARVRGQLVELAFEDGYGGLGLAAGAVAVGGLLFEGVQVVVVQVQGRGVVHLVEGGG